MSFSYSAVWDDTVRMLRANLSLLVPVAGMFLFLPNLIFGYAAPAPEPVADTSPMDAMLAYYEQNSFWMLLVFLIGFVGHLTILVMILGESGRTVGQAIRRAVVRLPVYLAVSILVVVALFLLLAPASIWLGISVSRGDVAIGYLGAILLALPVAYFSARLSTTAPIVAAEPQWGVIGIIRRSLALTRGKGWAIVGLVILVMVAFMVIQLASLFVFGSIARLLDLLTDGEGLGQLLVLIVASAISAIFNSVLFVLLAAIYRRLASMEGSTSGI